MCSSTYWNVCVLLNLLECLCAAQPTGMFVCCSTYWNVCVLLNLLECAKDSTGRNIFELLDIELQRCGLSWQNCLSFSADNASVMQGKHQGVAHYLHKELRDMYILGCPCHLMHLAAQRACNKLPASLDELLVDIFYYLDKSSKRKQSLQYFQLLNGKETKKIRKHVSTRLAKQYQGYLSSGSQSQTSSSPSWTSRNRRRKCRSLRAALSPSLDHTAPHPRQPRRTVQSLLHPPSQAFDLTSYLIKQAEVAKIAKDTADRKNEKSKAKESHTRLTPSVGLRLKPVNKVEKVHQLMANPHVKLYALFMKALLPVFDIANEALQKDEPMIHVLHSM